MIQETSIISDDSLHQQYLRKRDYERSGTKSLNPHMEVRLLIRGIHETLTLVPNESCYIGRFQMDFDEKVDVDLAPYGADRCGVSRVHACLEVASDKHVYITDLDSTNGTFVAGEQIVPYQPTMLHNGDEILLGALIMTIFIAE